MPEKLERPSDRTLINEAPIGVFVMDGDGHWLDVNPAACELVGYARQELLGMSLSDLRPVNGRLAENEIFDGQECGRTRTETVFVHRDGHEIAVGLDAVRIDDRIVAYVRQLPEGPERERDLATTQERMELALEGANLGIWDWDMRTDEVSRDELLTEMLGYSLTEMGDRMRGWEEIVHPTDKKRHDDELAEHIEQQTPYYQCDHRLRTKSGDWKWVRTMGKVVEREEDGTPLRAVGIHQDIDERKRTKLTLEAERNMFAEGPTVVFEWEDTDGWPIEYVSENVTDVLGYSPADLQADGVVYTDIVHKDDIDRVVNGAADRDASGDEHKNLDAYRVRTAEGDVRWVMEYTRRVSDSAQAPQRLGYLVDITARKQRERELQEREEKYRNLFEDTRDALMVFDRDGYIDCNERALDLFGIDSVDDFRQYSPWELSPPQQPDGRDSTEAAHSHFETAFEEGEAFFEWTHERLDGTAFPSEVKLSRFEYADEPVLHALVRDITERKQRERELEEREEKYRILFEDTRDALMLLDRDGFLDCNERTLALFGIDSVQEFQQLSPWELSPETQPDGTESRPTAQARIETAFDDGEAFFDWTHRRSDGTEFPAEVKLSRFQLDGEPALHALVRDITERKEYERALEGARRELRQVIDLFPDPIFVKNSSEELLLVNEPYAELVGSSREAVEGEREPEVFPDNAGYEQLRQRDADVLESGDSTVSEEAVRSADGQKHVFQTTRIPFETADTDQDAVLGYARDITHRKAYELKLEEQRDNLEILNQVVRHDIRNELQIVVAYAEMLLSEVEAEHGAYAKKALGAARDAIDITTTAREVTDVMLQSDVDHHAIRLRTVLEDVVEEVRSNYDAALVRIDGPLPDVSVRADDMLASAFRNVLTNAVQHNDKEIPAVTVSATTDEQRVEVRIADNGPGIPDDRKDKVFDQGEMGLDSDGTGLGLYLVDTLIGRYEGEVRVADNDPEGAIFIVALPTAR